MLRLIIQTTDYGAAANVGGPVETSIQSIDIDCPVAEAALREYEDAKTEAKTKGATIWWNRSVVGVEVLPRA